MQRRLWIGAAFVLGVSLGLRLWHLGQPPRLISDEWYFIQDARHYFARSTYTDIHPPLGKMQLAVIMNFFGDRPMAWRIGNAVAGTGLILLIGWTAGALTKSRRIGWWVGGLVALDGFLLTESRSGLINLPYIVYGWLTIAAVILALRSSRPRRWLFIAGITAGLALSVKWLAVIYVLPAVGLWMLPNLFGQIKTKPVSRGDAILSLGVVPMAVYWLVFQVHYLWLGVPSNLIHDHLVMLTNTFGEKTGHPYREFWWHWPLAWQPFPYWSELRSGQLSLIWSLPNPGLWWISWIVGAIVAARFRRDLRVRGLLIFGGAAWLFFALIQRDMFLYHAAPLSLWLICLLAVWLSDRWQKQRAAVIGILVAVTLSYFWFLPWYLNLPLAPADHKLREWLPTWQLKSSEVEYLRDYSNYRE